MHWAIQLCPPWTVNFKWSDPLIVDMDSNSPIKVSSFLSILHVNPIT